LATSSGGLAGAVTRSLAIARHGDNIVVDSSVTVRKALIEEDERNEGSEVSEPNAL
jgi:hypothetical protein